MLNLTRIIPTSQKPSGDRVNSTIMILDLSQTNEKTIGCIPPIVGAASVRFQQCMSGHEVHEFSSRRRVSAGTRNSAPSRTGLRTQQQEVCAEGVKRKGWPKGMKRKGWPEGVKRKGRPSKALKTSGEGTHEDTVTSDADQKSSSQYSKSHTEDEIRKGSGFEQTTAESASCADGDREECWPVKQISSPTDSMEGVQEDVNHATALSKKVDSTSFFISIFEFFLT